jgi:hypothetical protein
MLRVPMLPSMRNVRHLWQVVRRRLMREMLSLKGGRDRYTARSRAIPSKMHTQSIYNLWVVFAAHHLRISPIRQRQHGRRMPQHVRDSISQAQHSRHCVARHLFQVRRCILSHRFHGSSDAMVLRVFLRLLHALKYERRLEATLLRRLIVTVLRIIQR